MIAFVKGSSLTEAWLYTCMPQVRGLGRNGSKEHTKGVGQ